MVAWQPPRLPPPPPAVHRAPGQYTPGHGIRSNYSFWKGKCLLVLRHHMDGMAITFEELRDHLSQWDSAISQIDDNLLRQILQEDCQRFETITTTRALPSTSWKHSSRPLPPNMPGNFVPKTPGEPEESEEASEAASIKEEISSQCSSSPSRIPRKKIKNKKDVKNDMEIKRRRKE